MAHSSRGPTYYVTTYVTSSGSYGVPCTQEFRGWHRARHTDRRCRQPIRWSWRARMSGYEFTENVDAQETHEEHRAEEGRFGLVMGFDD